MQKHWQAVAALMSNVPDTFQQWLTEGAQDLGELAVAEMMMERQFLGSASLLLSGPVNGDMKSDNQQQQSDKKLGQVNT